MSQVNVTNTSGGSNSGSFLRAKSFYKDGNYFLFFILKYASGKITYVVSKNGSQQA